MLLIMNVKSELFLSAWSSLLSVSLAYMLLSVLRTGSATDMRRFFLLGPGDGDSIVGFTAGPMTVNNRDPETFRVELDSLTIYESVVDDVEKFVNDIDDVRTVPEFKLETGIRRSKYVHAGGPPVKPRRLVIHYRWIRDKVGGRHTLREELGASQRALGNSRAGVVLAEEVLSRNWIQGCRLRHDGQDGHVDRQ